MLIVTFPVPAGHRPDLEPQLRRGMTFSGHSGRSWMILSLQMTWRFFPTATDAGEDQHGCSELSTSGPQYPQREEQGLQIHSQHYLQLKNWVGRIPK